MGHVGLAAAAFLLANFLAGLPPELFEAGFSYSRDCEGSVFSKPGFKQRDGGVYQLSTVYAIIRHGHIAKRKAVYILLIAIHN